MAKTFAASHIPLLQAALNRLIPADGAFPGAGDLGLLDHLDRVACASTDARRTFTEGLRLIALESERRYSKAFEALAAAEQDVVLRHVESEQRAFFQALLSEVYQAYYSHPGVVAMLGFGAGPLQPGGHVLPPFDSGMTRAIGERPAFYRRL